MQLIKDKNFYKMAALIAVPIALQNVINVAVNMLDTVMLGRVGQAQLSASSLANQPSFLLMLLMFGLSSGASVLTAQYWGKGDVESIRRVMGIAMRVSLAAAIFAVLLVLFIPEQIMAIYTQDPELIRLGAQYMRIVSPTYLLMAVSVLYLNILRSMEKVNIALFVYFVSFLANGVLNYILIFGKLGLPAMGIAGAAVATSIARLIELVLVLWYARRRDDKLRFRLRDVLVRDRLLSKDFRKYSFPVVMNELFWGVGISVQQMILGHLGSDAVAASSVVSVIQRLSTTAVFGVAGATAVIVGKAVGRGDKEEARRAADTLVVCSIFLGIVGVGVMLLLRPLAVHMGVFTPQAKEYILQMMLVSAFYIFFMSFSTTNIIGVMRGGGDSRFALVIDIAALWFTTLFSGIVVAGVLHASVVVVYFVMVLDEPIKCVPGIIRLRSGKWMKNVTRNLKNS